MAETRAYGACINQILKIPEPAAVVTVAPDGEDPVTPAEFRVTSVSPVDAQTTTAESDVTSVSPTGDLTTKQEIIEERQISPPDVREDLQQALVQVNIFFLLF